MQEKGLEGSSQGCLTGSFLTEKVQDGKVAGASEYDVTEEGGKQVTEGYACILTEYFHKSAYIVMQLYSVTVLMYHKSFKLEYLRVVEIDF